jgi:Ca2+-binding RTX toxin-like protein
LATGFDKPDFRWVGTQNRLGAAMAYRTVGFESSEITDADASDGIVEVSGLRFTVTAQGNWTLNFSNGRLNFAEDPAYASSQFKIEITNVTGGSLEYNDFILNYQSDPLVVDGWAPYLNFAGWSISDTDLTGNYTYNGEWSYKHQIPGFPMPGSGVVTKLVITDNPAEGSTQNPYSSFWLDQLVVDTDYAPPIVAPTVGSVSSSDSNRAYKAGDVIRVTVTFDQAIEVNTAGGTPTLQLETGNTDRVAVYSGGNGTKTLTFEYTVQAGDTSADLDYISSTALSLNGATIKLAGSTTNATLTLPTPGTAGSLGANKAIIIDTTAPNAPAAPDLDATFDGGVSNTDNVTNHATLTFNGAAEAGVATVKLYDSDGITEIGSGSVSNGSYSITTSFPLADGTHTIIAKAIDTAGNVSTASSSVTVTVDTAPPTVSITSSQSVLKAGETATITFTFSEDPGATFTWNGSAGDIVVSGGTLSALSGSGTTRTAVFTPSAGLNSGAAGITVAAGSYIDAAGNNGGAGVTPSLTFDTLAPPAPIILAPANGATTNDRRPSITGIAEAGTTVTVIVDGTAVGITSVDGSGNWSFTVPTPLAGGAHTFRAQAIDAAGNTSAHSSTVSTTIDNAAPAVAITSASRTDDPTPVIAGTAETEATIRLSIGGAIYITTAAQGTWSVDLGLATPASGSLSLDRNGDNLVSVTAMDAVGNVSSSVTQTLEININDLPTGAVAISGVAVKGEMLTASHTLADADGLGLISYQWQADGADIPGATGATLILAEAQVGKAVTVKASYTDGNGNAESVTAVATAPVMLMPDAETAPNAGGGMDITITDPSQLTASLGTSGVDHVFYAGSGTVILPDTIENITLWGNADVQGNELGNLMRRGSGQNMLNGMGGDDTLYGDQGNDQVYGGTGNDVVSGGAGQDRVYGGSGIDNVQGGAGNDRVYGDAGRDTVSGGSGNDFVEGGSGDDRLSGAVGQDRLYGGEGRDLLSGGSGHDWLFGGSGQDTLHGGSGHDRFVFDTRLSQSGNVDVIQDFTASEDRIVLDDVVFTALGKGSAKGVMIASGDYQEFRVGPLR